MSNTQIKLINPYLLIWFKGQLRFVNEYYETFFLLQESLPKIKTSAPPAIAYYYTKKGNYGAFYITRSMMNKVSFKYFASSVTPRKFISTSKLTEAQVPEDFRTQILLLGV